MQEKAKKLVATYLRIKPEEVFVVWYCKTLKNWKCILSTLSVRQYLFEVTHNGETGETYVDVYKKEENFAVKD